MPYSAREPEFLPLTVSAAREAVATQAVSVVDPTAKGLLHGAVEANSAAADCWLALIAGCHSPARRVLRTRLRDLTEATSTYAGARWWLGAGSIHRRRVDDAENRIADAVRDSDGAEFAEAFVGYDHAVATAVVCAHRNRRTAESAELAMIPAARGDDGRAESTMGSSST